jgi:basic membrane protein A
VDALPENVAAFQINVHDSSFLGGVIAGMLTKTKTVGAVVGGDSPGLNQFYWAYKQGVMEVCPDCEVLVSYLNFDFANPTLGKEAALGQYDQGADIIFQVAGPRVKACFPPPRREDCMRWALTRTRTTLRQAISSSR